MTTDPNAKKEQKFLEGISLTAKMLGLTLAMGAAVWVLLDYVQSKDLRQTFLNELSSQLIESARTDRTNLDRHLQKFQHIAKLIVLQKRFLDFVDQQDWSPEPSVPAIHHSFQIPSWMPQASVLRNFFDARHALLIDSHGHVREIYHHLMHSETEHDLPKTLLQPSMLLRKLSHSQAYMTSIEGIPYVIASQPFGDDAVGDATPGMLMLASPIDNDFLAMAQHDMSRSPTQIALVDTESGLIVASSDQVKIPAGIPQSELEGRFLAIGKSFFDYGASDLKHQFTSFLATETVDQRVAHILHKNSQQRAVLAAILVLCSCLLTMWIARRIRRLNNNVEQLSKDLLDISPLHTEGGDELCNLDKQFRHFSQEIIDARERLHREAAAKAELRHMAHHDALTQLPNRTLLLDRLTQAISLAERTHQQLAVLFLDLDGFKAINDSLGHDIGDLVLQETARRLLQCVRESDTVCRMGGDEFTVILQETKESQAVAHVAGKILKALSRPFRFGDAAPCISTSIGIALFPHDGTEAGTLLKKADQAMYQAKEDGKNTYCLFASEIDSGT